MTRNINIQIDKLKRDCLFRYRDFNNNTINELLTGNIWHSKPEFLNDPFEFHFEFDWDEFSIKNLAAINNEWKLIPQIYLENLYLGDRSYLEHFFKSLKKQVNLIIENQRATFNEQSYVCCFSSNIDSPLMWSHYANGMQGICIAYKEQAISASEDFGMTVPVDYVNSPKKITYRNLEATSSLSEAQPIHDFANAIQPISHYITFNIQFTNYEFLIQKHKRWEYEGEYRHIAIGSKDNGSVGCVKNVENAIEAVIFGFRISPTNLTVLELICRKNGIRMYKATPNKSDYSVAIEEHIY
ncbi:DUF2971 domain-containing protein [Vibrio sp. IB15]|uniref:DUF2971 domain-containing protein n=1 Tax=Vibrio sp. IB15 TaxID=2779368 RepID=UPI0018E87C6D|nr:DUF2971 domain-containing protein [Vibrio sp. IB15]MBJ2145355.1 DUF2971 domain-containing protein [Vibrio sp. IB15]